MENEAKTPFDLQEFLASKKRMVDAALDNVFSESVAPPVLFSSMRYSLLASGKRLRPILCLAAAETFGVAPGQALPAALALEMIHCYSLIHDDLPSMDNDDLRRGRPTNHKVFGDATALLAGDALLTYAFDILADESPFVPPARQLQMIKVLANAAGPYGMVGGQQADLLAEGKEGTIADLEFIHRRKTAALIQASVVIGGLHAELDDAQRQALIVYGENIGLAFQMMDDWLDVVSTTEVLGKTVGRDEALDKFTYPRLIGLDATKDAAVRCVDKAISALKDARVESPQLFALAAYVTNRSV